MRNDTPLSLLHVIEGQQGALHALIAMLNTTTRGSNESGFAGDVQNASADNCALILGEKRLGSVSESQAVESIEFPLRNSRFVDRGIFLFKTGSYRSCPFIRLVDRKST